MPGWKQLRLRLRADSVRLAGLRAEEARADAQRRLREFRDDIEVTYLARQPPDSLDVSLLVPLEFPAADLDEIVAALRAALQLGPGDSELLPERPGTTRGPGGGRAIPIVATSCSDCGLTDGRHVPGCPSTPH